MGVSREWYQQCYGKAGGGCGYENRMFFRRYRIRALLLGELIH